jgi:hypothetical protein
MPYALIIHVIELEIFPLPVREIFPLPVRVPREGEYKRSTSSRTKYASDFSVAVLCIVSATWSKNVSFLGPTKVVFVNMNVYAGTMARLSGGCCTYQRHTSQGDRTCPFFKGRRYCRKRTKSKSKQTDDSSVYTICAWTF